MRVLFCGGGTAGHVNPALAVAEAIMRNIPGAEVAYVVTEKGIENKLVSFKKYKISVDKFQSKVSVSNLKSAWKMIKSFKESRRIIKDFKPDLIFGTGGYATFPVIRTGHRLGVKTVIHESNAVMGRALRMLSSMADAVLLNFEEAKKYVKGDNKCYVVGNPVRSAISTIVTEKPHTASGDSSINILCVGGSMGAESINDGALELIRELIASDKSLSMVLSTGKRDFERVNKKYNLMNLDCHKRVRICEYITDMAQALREAEIIISRAGAVTLSELSISGKCAILIPSPHVVDNHQLKNAMSYVKKNAALMVEEGNIEDLVKSVRYLLENDKKRGELEQNIRKFTQKDATKEILGILIDICHDNK